MADKPRTVQIEIPAELYAILESAAARCRTTPERIAAEAIEVSRLWLAEVRPLPRHEVNAIVGRMGLWLRAALPQDAADVPAAELPRWWRSTGRAAYLRARRGPQREQTAAEVDAVIAKIEALLVHGRTAIGPA